MVKQSTTQLRYIGGKHHTAYHRIEPQSGTYPPPQNRKPEISPKKPLKPFTILHYSPLPARRQTQKKPEANRKRYPTKSIATPQQKPKGRGKAASNMHSNKSDDRNVFATPHVFPSLP